MSKRRHRCCRMDSAYMKDAAQELQAGRLYLRRKDKQLLRLLCVDAEAEQAYFKRVSTKWNSTPSLCEEVSTRTAIQMLISNALQPREECVRPAFMLQTDRQIRESEQDKERQRRKDSKRSAKRANKAVERLDVENPGQERIDKRDKEFALIEPLVTETGIYATFNPRSSRTVIASRAEQVGCSMQFLERLIHRFAWFGLMKNALLRLNEQKGPAQVVRSLRGLHKLGRPNAFVVAGYRVKTMQGVNVTEKDVRKFDAALKRWHIREDLTLEETYELMCRELYIGVTRLQTGERIERRISRKHIPSIEQFKYWCQVLWTAGHAERKAGPKDAASLASNQVGDISIAKNVADVFDIDATEFNRELIAGFIDNGKTVNIGKAVVVLVFDRRSRKVVGWYVYAGSENWEEGYRLALFRSLVRNAKLRRLDYLGIEQLEDYPLWVENPKPLYVYSDNGPNSSKPARLALDRLGCAPALAPPDTPHWKPTVEGGLGNFQSKHSRLSGGYTRTRRARDKDMRRLAKQMADSTLFQFEQKLVQQIIEYNAALNVQHMLSADMLGVRGSPDGIFSWGARKIGGLTNRLLDEAVVYLALLEHKTGARLTKDGVRHNSAHYYCDSLRNFYERGERKVDFVAHPRHEDEVFWLSPEGTLTQLTMDARDAMRIGKRSVIDQKMLEVHQRMQVIEERKTGRSAAISARQQDVLKRHKRPSRQRVAPTKHQNEYRAIQAELDRSNDIEDRTVTHLVVERGGNRDGPATPIALQGKPPFTEALTSSSLTPNTPASEKSDQAPRTLPQGLQKPSLPERFNSADRWEEEDE